jgi:hypothetical protein
LSGLGKHSHFAVQEIREWFKKVFGIEREEERIRESMMPIIYRGGRCCTYIAKCSETINKKMSRKWLIVVAK